jgi:BMFP domain-containing protein YqiC
MRQRQGEDEREQDRNVFEHGVELLSFPFAFLIVSRYSPAMQSQNPFLDEMAKITQAAMGVAQAAGEEAKSAFRAQSDKWAAELDLIRREEFDALKAEVAALRAQITALEIKPAP